MAMRRSTALLTFALSAICAGCSTPEPLGISKRIAATCTEANLDERFFRGVFSGENELNLADARGISKLLDTLREPSLSCDVRADEAYRLVYMPERGDALTIRIERLKDSYSVRISTKAAEGGKPRPNNQAVTRQEWGKVTDAISSYNFWSRSPYPSASTISDGVIVLHGPAWLLEGQRDGWYHAVSRVSALNEAGFDLPARALFEVAEQEVPGVVRAR